MSKKIITSLLFSAVALAAGCGKAPAKPPAPPVAEVSVLSVGSESVTLTTELPGRVNAMREAQVRARATGILLKRLFEEGAEVKAGQVLFEIDPLPLEAALNSAKAEQARTEATLKEARATVDRYTELVSINAVSKQVYDQALATLAEAEAELLARKEAVQTAELNLSYTKVTAPIAGRIGKALVTEGALVSAPEATQLAVIRQLDPVYFDITQSSNELLKLRRAMEEGSIRSVAPGEASIALILDDGTRYRHLGKLLFSDVSVDPTTGMVTLRGEVPNPDHILMPGLFARAELVQGVITNAVTVPQRTIARGASGKSTVLVVNDDSKVEVRSIEIAREIGTKVVVSEGLKPGERIIVEGSQKAPPGTVVKTVPFEAQKLANASPVNSPAANTH
jgi:membrane fusion protein, multidrug efflux system